VEAAGEVNDGGADSKRGDVTRPALPRAVPLARDVRVFAGADEVAEAAADLVLEAAREAIAARGAFRIALAGGSTPRRLYEILAARAAHREMGAGAVSSDPSAASATGETGTVLTNPGSPSSMKTGEAARLLEAGVISVTDAVATVRDSRATPSSARFDAWHVFFGDERFVPADHPDSNYRMAREALLDHVEIPAAQVHRIETDAGSPGEVATGYAAMIAGQFGLGDRELPCFDLILLGMGADGHTASLFPGTTALDAGPDEIVVATRVEKLDAWRVTLTLATINAARRVVFLIAGIEKREAAASVLRGDGTLPAARVCPVNGALVFLVDRDALPSSMA
jgi:6-phosphogluconolactonase